MKTATSFLLAALVFSPALQAKDSITLDDFANGSVKVSDFVTPPQPEIPVTLPKSSDKVIAPYKQTKGIPSLSIEVQDENGVWREIVPEHDNNGRTIYTVAPGYKSRWAPKCSSTGSGTWYFKLQTFNKPAFGGHIHTNPPPPPLKYQLEGETSWHNLTSLTSAFQPVNKERRFFIEMPAYATQVDTVFDYLGVCTGTYHTTWLVKVVGLEPLPNYFDIYETIGATPEHPDNHYGTPQMNQALINFANDWTYNVCITTNIIVINDMSLKYGGKFDLKGKWDKSKSHDKHKFGNSADLRKWNIKKKDRKLFVEKLCEKFDVLSEGNGNGEQIHYHVQLRGAPAELTDEPEDDTRSKKCCSSDIPTECIDLKNSKKEDETSSDCATTNYETQY